jgi:eukaryotic-like serine/threonine-protein kinase
MMKPIAAGSRFGPYEAISALGAGGMGEVWRARDTRLRREVALKFLPAEVSLDAARLARFEQEAQAASALNHPAIVTVYDIGTADGIAYIAMELIDGQTLRALLADGPMPARRVAPLAAEVASGLAAAHEAGIVHRDIKPENLMITRDGRVKILDFGLAKPVPTSSGALSEMATAAAATEPGTLLGTVSYMSPEQARALPLDHRSDLFSFGAVLYEMLSGRRPFAGASTADILSAILREEPAELSPAAPPALDRIIRRCLEKQPERRFQSARDLAFALEALSGLTSSVSVSAAAPPARTALRPGMAILAAVAVVAAFGAGLLLRPAVAGRRPPFFSSVTRLTAGPAQEFSPVLSPDGKWIAYLSDARGPVDVWVRFLAGGEPANLTEKLGITVQRKSEIGGLDISPDGSQIAFDAGPPSAVDGTANSVPFGVPGSFGGIESWVIPAPLGGTPRRLVERGHAARWSPDGRSIVFVRAGSTLGDGLSVADADGGNIREILKPRAGLHAHWPAWSADGRFVYFISSLTTTNSEPSEICRVPASGGAVEVVVKTTRRAVHPAPTAGGLFYAANPDSADPALWWRPLSRGEPVRLTTGVGAYAEPRISADGRSVVATLLEAKQSLISIPIGSGPAPAARDLTDGYFGDFDPALSPKGDRLVWSSARAGNRNLWTGAPDATRSRPLTVGSAFDERPAFSPDGGRVAFVSDRGGSRGIWLIASDGGAPKLVAAAQVIDTLTWSPDGKEIVFAAPAGDLPGLFRVSLADGKITRLPTPSGAFAPAWSPDGHAIAFLEITPGKPVGVGLMSPEGRLMPGLKTGAASFTNGFLAWRADSRHLLAAAIPGALDASVWLIGTEGEEPLRKVAEFPATMRVRGMAVSPDGAFAVLGRYQPSSDIVLFTVR